MDINILLYIRLIVELFNRLNDSTNNHYTCANLCGFY
jgi:hypothetical protein